MQIAPSHILKAANETISWACVFVRNKSLHDDCSVEMINDMMEAIHDIPMQLNNWQVDSEKILRLHLSCFESDKWPNSPNLVDFFEHRLAEHME